MRGRREEHYGDPGDELDSGSDAEEKAEEDEEDEEEEEEEEGETGDSEVCRSTAAKDLHLSHGKYEVFLRLSLVYAQYRCF